MAVLAPSEQVVAIALRHTFPEFLATAAKTVILVKFLRDHLDLSRAQGARLRPETQRVQIGTLKFRHDPLENPTRVMCPFLGGATKSLLFFLNVKFPNH
jgi:hypothetical protein